MKKPVFIALILLAASFANAADFDPFACDAKPIAVFIETNPWAMVMGADTPNVAIYDNGEAIFVKKSGDGYAMFHTRLDDAALAAVREKLQAAAGLKSRYSLTNWTDQPESKFYFNNGGSEIATVVYGRIGASPKAPAFSSGSEFKADTLPDGLLKLHRWLATFDAPKAGKWTPKYVEVMLWDYSYAPDKSIHWPKQWPGLTSDRAIKRGDSYSIFLDGALLPELGKFVASRREKGAVELDGKKWAISYRYVFPGEPAWSAALRAVK